MFRHPARDTIATIEGGAQSSFRFARRRGAWVACLAVLTAALLAPAAASADRYVYVSNGFPAGSNDVSALHINSDGSLTPVSGSPFPTGGTTTEGLSMTPDAQHLYVAEFGTNGVVGFNVQADGGLSTAPNSPYTPATSALGVIPSPDGQHVFVWNHNADTIGTWTVSGDGSLSQIPSSPIHIPGGLHNPFAGSVAPDGRNVFVPNENSDPVAGISTDKVSAYDTGPDGSLGAHQDIASGNPSPGGSNPFGSGITPNGEFFYTSNPEDGPNGTLDGYQVSNGGFLTELSGFPISVAPGNHPLNIAISPDGEHLYVATRISNTVNAYDIGFGTGSLTPIPGSPFATGGTNGKALAFTPDGSRLYVSNNGSDNISGFNVASDGSLTQIPGSPWPTGGIDPDLESIAITPNQAPTADIAVKSKPKKKSARFDATGSSDSDGTVAVYSWGFGDTFLGSGPIVRHHYQQPGTYTVNLILRDNEGCSIDRIFTGKATLCNGSPAAQATLDVVARKLTIHYKNRTQKFKGKLKADKKGCRHQMVKVFRKRKGKSHDQKIGKDKTNSAGKWSLKEPGASGRFYVQVKQKDLPSGTPCLAKKSQGIGVG